MATIGRGMYARAVHEFFEGLRTYDAGRAAAVLAEDADLESPWNEGVLTGRKEIQGVLETMLSDPIGRPSFSIDDISGDGAVVRLVISVSHRFGERPQRFRLHLVHLKDQIHHARFQPVKPGSHVFGPRP